jgi:hypothetical protein
MDLVEFEMKKVMMSMESRWLNWLSTERIDSWKKDGGGGWGKVFVVSEKRVGDLEFASQVGWP